MSCDSLGVDVELKTGELVLELTSLSAAAELRPVLLAGEHGLVEGVVLAGGRGHRNSPLSLGELGEELGPGSDHDS